MRHFIIAKFRPEITAEEKREMYPAITSLFENTKKLSGVHGVIVHTNCTPRDNRYDLMIEIVMDASALSAYDACEWHHEWKEKYGPMLEKKAIFDCED